MGELEGALPFTTQEYTMTTNTLTSLVLFTLTACVDLPCSSCGSGDDDTNCANDADCTDDDTGDPPVTMQLAYEVSELGIPQGDVLATQLGDEVAHSGNSTAGGTILTLQANKLTWLTAGDANRLVEGEPTPLFEDANGLWATMPKQLAFDDAAGELYIFSPTYDTVCNTASPHYWETHDGQTADCEDPLSVYPVPDGVMNLTANLNLWFDFGAAVCHYDNGEGGTGDYDQDRLAVEYGYKLEVMGVTDSDKWIEVVGDTLQLMNSESAIVNSTINQKDGIVSFTTSAGENITCQ
jgi:hypothetical protein